jgi:diadenosine tetraphosphate (Ap4A) HIT family hydrolase
MAADGIFCEIAEESAPANLVFQNEELIAFRDISPAAPTHILIVPRQHIVDTSEVNDLTPPLVGRMVQLAAQIARAGCREERLPPNERPGLTVGERPARRYNGQPWKDGKECILKRSCKKTSRPR